MIVAANQEATRSWWETSRSRYELFISDIVTQEASGGDLEAAKRRVSAIEGFPSLDVSEEVELLATQLLANAIMRTKIEAICRAAEYEPPVICTPLELVEE